MAADAYLLDLAEKGESKPVLRLYGWDRPSITIGYHQRLERAVAADNLGDTPVVRRVTGGRALLHDDGEITYALAGNFRRYPSLGATLHDSYNLIARAIVAFYRSCGREAVISHRDDPVGMSKKENIQKGCFASVSRYEIILGGQKVAAGSQRRTQQAFVQHGSIRLAAAEPHPAIDGGSEVVGGDKLEAISGDRREILNKLIEAFEDIYKVNFIDRGFEASEKAVVAGLENDYGNLNGA